jgi:hypothetical protein
MPDVKALAHPEVPDVGVLPGKVNLNAPAPPGSIRPFHQGEYLTNPNGSWSNEMSTTVAHPALNRGMPTNVPTLWLIDGKPTRVTDEQAAMLAAQSGLNFTAYPNAHAADQAATARENGWQNIEPSQSGTVAPLWTDPKRTPPPTPTPRPGSMGGLIR